jgi:hypothetical protein
MTQTQIAAGSKFSPLGSLFPVAFEVVSVHQVHPVVVIREHVGDETFDREVRESVIRHALKVWAH